MKLATLFIVFVAAAFAAEDTPCRVADKGECRSPAVDNYVDYSGKRYCCDKKVYGDTEEVDGKCFCTGEPENYDDYYDDDGAKDDDHDLDHSFDIGKVVDDKSATAKDGTKPKPGSGTDPKPADKDNGGDPKAADKDSGGDPKPADKDNGGDPKPADKDNGGEPKPADKDNGSEPKPADKDSVGQPKPADKDNGGDPKPADKDNGGDPKPADKNNGGDPKPADKDNGGDPKPADKNNGGDPKPAYKDNGTDPKPADKDDDADADPKSLDGHVGKEPKRTNDSDSKIGDGNDSTGAASGTTNCSSTTLYECLQNKDCQDIPNLNSLRLVESSGIFCCDSNLYTTLTVINEKCVCLKYEPGVSKSSPESSPDKSKDCSSPTEGNCLRDAACQDVPHLSHLNFNDSSGKYCCDSNVYTGLTFRNQECKCVKPKVFLYTNKDGGTGKLGTDVMDIAAGSLLTGGNCVKG